MRMDKSVDMRENFATLKWEALCRQLYDFGGGGMISTEQVTEYSP